ncbi:MAG: hypothetical protein LCI00_21020 [Chloroflexi bacterium]|nr:hypothetical protein [Chloroflexota bacterium]MCC6892409.1 hypothetical protein [Anaerolineae bacterium]
MSSYLRAWLRPPVLAHDEEQLVARLLHYILLLTFTANLIYTASVVVFGLSSDLLWVNGVVLVGIGVLIGMLHQHYVRGVGWIFSILLLLMVLAAGFDNGVGLTDLNYGVSIVLVLVVASVVLGWWGAIIFTLLVIACSIVLYMVLPLPAGFTLETVRLTLLLDCVIFTIVGFFTGYSVYSLSNALSRAQVSEHGLAKNNAQLLAEIAERERVAHALRVTEEQHKQLHKRLRVLNSVSNELDKLATTDALCSKALELGHERLGFDRMSLYLVDDNVTTITTTFVTDRAGQCVVKRDQQAIPPDLLARLKQPEQPQTGVLVDDDILLQEGEPQRGWKLTSALYDDKGLMGWICADNLYGQQPFNPQDIEILQLYRITLEHLYSQKWAEQALVEMVVKKERVELINELVSNLSHDLRTPLSIINNSLYLLQKFDDPQRQREKAKVIEDQSRRLERLINDVLMMSKLEQQDTITMRPVRLNDLITPIKEGFAGTCETKQQTLTLSLETSIPFVLGNHDGLERIVSNLLENAINYTPDKGSVTLRTYKDGVFVMLEVTDTGIGISEADLPNIFDRFYRADRARSLKSGGTGLGLAITKRLVDMHKGKIEVTSKVGEGTTFKVSFVPSFAPQPAEAASTP